MPEAVSQAAPAAAAVTAVTAPVGVGLGTPAAAAPAAAVASPTGSEVVAAVTGEPWYKAHVKDADNLKAIETAKWADVDAIIKSHREAQQLISQKSAPASQAPSDPKEYAFTVPPELKDGYNEPFAEAFRKTAHKAGLSKEQAAAIHDGVLAFAKDSLATQSQSATEAMTTAVTTTKAALEKAWGQSITPGFAQNLEMAKRAATHLDPSLMQELRDVGAIVKVGNEDMIAKPAIFKALAKAGGQLFAEDTLYGNAASVANPFDPRTMDMKMQGHLIKTDPAKAKLLIRSAKQEAMWGHFLTP